VAEIPWGHHVLLLERVKDPEARAFYAQATLQHGWSRNILGLQIESGLADRQGKAPNNFPTTLPSPESDLAQQTLKDPYIFDFLTLQPKAAEKELQRGLLDHVQQFLLELGVGFALIGRDVAVRVGDRDFFLDLLFYHVRLRCFVVIELKVIPFEPEFTGKLNFYLSAVDSKCRHPQDGPTIGLLLCKGKDRLVAEYALRDLNKPIGIAEWQTRLVESLPDDLKSGLPSVQDLEREFSNQ